MSVVKPFEKKFPNGLTVIIYKSPYKTSTAPLFYFEMIIKAGIIQQKPEHIGYAHFLEHLLSFYSSGKYPDALQNQDTLRKFGIEMNAWTSYNTCGYYMYGLEKFSECMLDLLFNAISDPIWNEKNKTKINPNTKKLYLDEIFEQERNAVIRELSKLLDDPWYKMNTDMNDVLYKGTNMEFTVKQELENVKNVNKLNAATFKEFYKQFYKPSYLTLSIVANGDPKKLIAYLGRKYSSYLMSSPKQSIPKIKMPIPNPKPDNSVYFSKVTGNGEYKITFIFRLSNLTYFDNKSETLAIFEMISALLTGSLSSRLYKTLRSEMGAVYNVSSEINLDRRCGEYSYFSIDTMTSQQQCKNVVNAVVNHIDNFLPVRSDELENLKNRDYVYYSDLKQSKTFKKIFDEYNEFYLWEKSPITTDKELKLKSKILNSSPDLIKEYVDKYLKNNYYIFYSGKSKLKIKKFPE
jgi:predicted Zn-dependent peptidase